MGDKKIKTVLLLFIPVLVLGFLALQGFKNSAAYYYTIAEVAAMELKQDNKLRIKGELLPASVTYDPRLPLLSFTLEEGSHSLNVIYEGVLPDNFQHTREVIVEGKFGERGQFVVSKLMMQCPSKYEGED